MASPKATRVNLSGKRDGGNRVQRTNGIDARHVHSAAHPEARWPRPCRSIAQSPRSWVHPGTLVPGAPFALWAPPARGGRAAAADSARHDREHRREVDFDQEAGRHHRDGRARAEHQVFSLPLVEACGKRTRHLAEPHSHRVDDGPFQLGGAFSCRIVGDEKACAGLRVKGSLVNSRRVGNRRGLRSRCSRLQCSSRSRRCTPYRWRTRSRRRLSTSANRRAPSRCTVRAGALRSRRRLNTSVGRLGRRAWTPRSSPSQSTRGSRCRHQHREERARPSPLLTRPCAPRSS